MADRVSARVGRERGRQFRSREPKSPFKNLQDMVTQEDITTELTPMGPAQEGQMATAGVAEVVFVKMEDAKRPSKSNHDRLLDGKAMKCSIAR